MKIIDISHHQPIDFPFEKALKYNYYGFILRTGDGNKRDRHVSAYIDRCIELECPVGYYHYSRATKEANIKEEAKILADYAMRYCELGAYVDMEIYKDPDMQGYIFDVFQDEFRAITGSRIPLGLYTNEYNFNHYFHKEHYSGINLWIAKYNKNAPSVGMPIKMWQYTSSADSTDFVSYKLDRSIYFDEDITEDEGDIGVNEGSDKELTTIIKEVLNGVYGTGEKRKNSLLSAGINADQVQSEINRYYSVAMDVIAGVYGNGKIRRKAYEDMNIDYDIAQAIVKRLLNK